MRAPRLAPFLTLALAVLARPASAGSGDRSIPPPAETPKEPEEKAGKADKSAKPAKTTSEKEGPRTTGTSSTRPGTQKTHHTGRPPKSPRPTLPEGVEPPTPDAEARRQIAGGPTSEDVPQSKGDPELRELGEAERILFPRPLPGARAGFSWEAAAATGGDAVQASGLPPSQVFGGGSSDPDAERQAAWLKALVVPNLPVRLDARVVKYLHFYRDDQRGKSILRVWAKKSGRFVPALKAEFAKAGLSPDLVWLSLIESGHNPTILSSAGAAGLWQFIPESARLYGLTVDRWVDERLDPERSTSAAVKFLGDLRTRFGSVELSMAAYNMGHGALLRAMRRFNTNDFWTLARYEAGLPWETTLYVPKILATAIAMNNPKAFGIDDVTPDPPISFDTISVGPSTDLAEIARAADVQLDVIRALNAQYLTARTPPVSSGATSFRVKVPPGRGGIVEQRLASGEKRSGAPVETHVVRFGDTVEAVAAEHGVTVADVAAKNRLADGERPSAGQLLLVPARTEGAVPEPAPEEVVVVPARSFTEPGRTRVFYRVLPADRLAEVAAAFGVTPSQVAFWNALDESASLQQGMTLQIFVRKDHDLSRVRCLREHEARILVAGTEPFTEYFEAQNGRKRLVVTAKPGDTLVGIGRRYGMSAGMMERINRMSASTPLTLGQRVVVYTKGEVPGQIAPAPSAPRELSAVLSPAPEALPPLPIAGNLPNGARAVIP